LVNKKIDTEETKIDREGKKGIILSLWG